MLRNLARSLFQEDKFCRYAEAEEASPVLSSEINTYRRAPHIFRYPQRSSRPSEWVEYKALLGASAGDTTAREFLGERAGMHGLAFSGRELPDRFDRLWSIVPVMIVIFVIAILAINIGEIYASASNSTEAEKLAPIPTFSDLHEAQLANGLKRGPKVIYSEDKVEADISIHASLDIDRGVIYYYKKKNSDWVALGPDFYASEEIQKMIADAHENSVVLVVGRSVALLDPFGAFGEVTRKNKLIWVLYNGPRIETDDPAIIAEVKESVILETERSSPGYSASWVQVAGPKVIIPRVHAHWTYFVPPKDGTYEFSAEITLNQGHGKYLKNCKVVVKDGKESTKEFTYITSEATPGVTTKNGAEKAEEKPPNPNPPNPLPTPSK